jgi:hypothetical protein
LLQCVSFDGRMLNGARATAAGARLGKTDAKA